MKNFGFKTSVLICVLVFSFHFGKAQQAEMPPARQTVAVLAPLYLDSAFTGSVYKLTGNSIPRYILPGLDFYHGIMSAIDSLRRENTPVDVEIYDTKKDGGINSTLAEIKQSNAGLIIAAFNSPAEQKTVGQFAFDENIPVISATYPNNANLNMNPFFVMINSTLQTHVSAMYNYVQHNYSKSKILFITKNGSFETRIKNQFDNLNRFNGLKYKTASLTETFDPAYLLSALDSTKQNLIICGSLTEGFGLNVVRAISAAKTYRVTVLGPPTWESAEGFDGPDCAGVEIVYSTPYNYSRTDKLGANLTALYKTEHMGRPSDMYFKGFECMYHFSKLLVKYRTNLLNNISESSSYKIANDFYFEPVRLSKESFSPDYLENKRIYFIKKMDGVVKSIN